MIIGITGTNGAGKGEMVKYLVENKGFKHYSVRDAITEEIVRRSLPVTRPTMTEIGTDLRKNHGADYFTRLFLARAKQEGVTNAVMESIRSVSEAENLKVNGAFLLAIDADRTIRYERIMKRASATDLVTFEEFCQQEDREMDSEDPSDPAVMDVRKVIEMADCKLQNNTTPEELYAEIDALPIFK